MKVIKFAKQCIKKPITRYQLKKAGYSIIGEGSGRIVVEYSPTIAIKFAKNNKGLVQNRVELETFLDIKYRYNSNRLATILDFIKDDNDKVIALIVRKYPLKVRKLSKIIVKNLKERLENFNGLDPSLLRTDLDFNSSWRKTNSGKLVCVDYGFNNDTKKIYGFAVGEIRLETYVETMR